MTKKHSILALLCFGITVVAEAQQNMEEKIETIVLCEAYTEIVIQDVQFKTVTEQVLVRPAAPEGTIFMPVTEHIMIKKEANRIVSNLYLREDTKEIAVEKPCNGAPKMMEYISKIVLTPAGTRTIDIPAEYTTIMRYEVQTRGNGAVEMPAIYKTITKKVLETPSKVLEEIFHPAQTQMVTVKYCTAPMPAPEVDSIVTITLKAAYTDLEVIPAQYRTVTEQMLSKEQANEGAVFETVTDQILVKEASTNLIVTPAIWKNIKKEQAISQPCNGKKIRKMTYMTAVQTQAATVKKIEIPAEYRVVERKIVKRQGKGAAIPAEYRTIQKQKLDIPASLRGIEYPAETKNINIERCK